MVDQGFPRHAKIAVPVVRRHKPLVAPKKMNFLPVERRAQIREQFVSALRRRAAGKAKAKTLRGAGNPCRDGVRDLPRQGLGIHLDLDDRIRGHWHITSAFEAVSDANGLKNSDDGNGSGYRFSDDTRGRDGTRHRGSPHAAATVHAAAVHSAPVHPAAVHTTPIYPPP